ncbi:ParB/RepB/Spo0J family partition protein [candidate division KSB1 bacterium]|nr:ParB/RepB/Spo0J family partition protein [candidate division KSB1 bacterium]
MKTNRLGRGLEALIPQNSPEDEAGRPRSLDQIEVASIRVNPQQPRLAFDPKRLDELKQSIKEHGIIQPITVHKNDSGYELVSGERRLRAVSDLGFERIPAYIIEVHSQDELLELALIENIQREDLNPIEIAQAYQKLQKNHGLTQEAVAQKVGKDRATVANFIRLLKLPGKVQDCLSKDEISMGHARALMGLPKMEDQIQLCKKIVSQQINVRQVEEAVRKVVEGAKPVSKLKVRDTFIIEIEDKIREIVSSQVRVRKLGKGGRIEIDYFSDEDLERIMDLLNSIQS